MILHLIIMLGPTCLKKILFISVIIFITTAPEASESVVIVKNGLPNAAIILPENPLQVVNESALELQKYIKSSTDADIKIFHEKEAPAGISKIYLGNCQATLQAGISPSNFLPNEFRIKTLNNNLYLFGDDSAGPPFGILHNNRTRVGTLFAVYEFLEKQLGILWLWPGEIGEVVPHRMNVSIEACDVHGTPIFIHTRWRDGGWVINGKAGWVSPKARDKFFEEQSRWLRRHRFAMGINLDMKHSFSEWWPTYHLNRKEIFNLLPDNTRRPDPLGSNTGDSRFVSMCVSNPILHRMVIEKWKREIENSKIIELHIDVSENDTPGKCTCTECLMWDDFPGATINELRKVAANEAFQKGDEKWYQHLGSLSDRYAKFFLSIQKLAEGEFPETVVMGLAYLNYLEAPIHTTLNDKIIIGVVPTVRIPWTIEQSRKNRTQWDGWRATGARLLLRPNWMLEGHNMPVMFARELGDDFRYFASRGMIGTDFDSLTGQYGTQGPNLYMLARLHSDPEKPVENVLMEYFSAFGKASDIVRKYFTYWEKINHSIKEKAKDLYWAHFYRQSIHIYTRDVIQKGFDMLKAAQEIADDDPFITRRMQIPS